MVACFVLVCSGLEEQLQQAKQHAEQFKSMSEANETALSDLNKVILYSQSGYSCSQSQNVLHQTKLIAYHEDSEQT